MTIFYINSESNSHLPWLMTSDSRYDLLDEIFSLAAKLCSEHKVYEYIVDGELREVMLLRTSLIHIR